MLHGTLAEADQDTGVRAGRRIQCISGMSSSNKLGFWVALFYVQRTGRSNIELQASGPSQLATVELLDRLLTGSGWLGAFHHLSRFKKLKSGYDYGIKVLSLVQFP